MISLMEIIPNSPERMPPAMVRPVPLGNLGCTAALPVLFALGAGPLGGTFCCAAPVLGC